jgi:hypothetical protein
VQPKITVARWPIAPEEWIEQHATEDHEVSIADVPTVEAAVPAVLDTLVFIPDEGILYQVFRGVCALKSLDVPEVAQVTITM